MIYRKCDHNIYSIVPDNMEGNKSYTLAGQEDVLQSCNHNLQMTVGQQPTTYTHWICRYAAIATCTVFTYKFTDTKSCYTIARVLAN